MRTVAATRYVTALREGGSVPALVEASDGGLYVVKLRGAAQGAKALIAELIGGGVGRALGLPVPELVLVEIDPLLARAEPNPELQGPLRASAGINLGMRFLSGALPFDPAAWPVEPALASRIVWFDAFIGNVDRTPRNTNILVWERALQLIDHGAALYHQHDWDHFVGCASRRFPQVRQHVLWPFATELVAADRALAPLLTRDRLRSLVDELPALWLTSDGQDEVAARASYLEYLTRRLAGPRAFVEEAMDAGGV